MYQRILLAVDGSSTSDAALEEGIKLAKDQGARLRLVHVLDFSPLAWGTEGYIDLTVIEDAIRRTGEQILAKASQRAAEQKVEVESELLECFGERVPHRISEEAEHWGADLIVIGTHGRRGFDHLLLGSVAEGVSRRASVPVLLVRAA